MAIQTIDLRKVKEKNVNVYEICLAVAARARQINSKRIAEKKENEILDDMDMYDETDIFDRELMKDIKFEKEVNPTVVAQEEFFEGKVRITYPEKEPENKE